MSEEWFMLTKVDWGREGENNKHSSCTVHPLHPTIIEPLKKELQENFFAQCPIPVYLHKKQGWQLEHA